MSPALAIDKGSRHQARVIARTQLASGLPGSGGINLVVVAPDLTRPARCSRAALTEILPPHRQRPQPGLRASACRIYPPSPIRPGPHFRGTPRISVAPLREPLPCPTDSTNAARRDGRPHATAQRKGMVLPCRTTRLWVSPLVLFMVPPRGPCPGLDPAGTLAARSTSPQRDLPPSTRPRPCPARSLAAFTHPANATQSSLPHTVTVGIRRDPQVRDRVSALKACCEGWREGAFTP